MSASRKKKLRQEQLASGLTEKQATAKKEARRLKVYSIVFAVVLVLMVCVLLFTVVTNSGIIERNTTALKVNNHKVSTVDLNYYYMDSVNNWYSQNGSYAGLFGLDATVALDQQEYTEGTTWADFFVEQAKESARSTYALYDAAMAEGFTLSDDEKAVLDSNMESMAMYAAYYGYANADGYIQAVYGKGSNEKTLRAHNEISAIASAYYAAHQDSLTYTDADYRAEEADNFNAYSSFDFSYYTVNASSFYEGGTEDEDGNVTYSDEEQAAGLKAAEAAAKKVADAATSIDAMNEAIEALELDSTAATSQTNVQYANVMAALQDWVSDSSRTAGDTTIIDRTSTDEEGNETTIGYYVVYFEGANDNTFSLVNVRHILIPFEGGEEDENGNVTYSDEDYANTEASAQAILDAWDGTEDGFAALAEEHSTDTGSSSNGGLYEDVYPGQMVTNFNDWCFDASRQVGDTGIVKSDYGYHIMFFSGYSDITYRDYMIRNKLLNDDMTTWYNALVEAVTVDTVNVSKINRGLVLNTETE